MLAVACGCATGEVRPRDAPSPDSGSLDSGALDSGALDPSDVISISIEPADLVVDDVPSGGGTAIAYSAIGRTAAGIRGPVLAMLGVDDASLGTIDATSGVFTTSGALGTLTVRAALSARPAITATTSLTLRRFSVVYGDGVSEADARRYADAPIGDAASAPRIDYPLSGAVMPMNVLAPKIMWTARHAGGAADLWHVRLTRGASTSIEGYFLATADFDDSFRPDADAWRSMARGDLDEEIALEVGVLSGGERFESQLRFRTVDAFIAGAVYYWSPTQGRLERLEVGTGTSTDFMPSPARADGDTGRAASCAGCHAISRDGRLLVTGLNDRLTIEPPGSVKLFDLTADLSVPDAPHLAELTSQESSGGINWPTFSPDNRWVLFGRGTHPPGSGPFLLWDIASDRVSAPAAGAPGVGYAPEWSPDGSAIAFTNADDQLAVTAVTSALGATSAAFGASQVLYRPPSGVAFRPTWSPDSRWIVFQVGGERSSAGGCSLVMQARAGGAATPLAAAGSNACVPSFSPFTAGGRYWLMFTSRRQYGNARAGYAGAQLWVSAIDASYDRAGDRSSVPYYLDGQAAAYTTSAGTTAISTNLAPYWAPSACRAQSESCTSDDDCCSGVCDATLHTCGHPTMRDCRPRTASCETDSDCCGSLPCTGHVCEPPGLI